MINYWSAGIYPRNEKLIESTRSYDKTLEKQFKKEKSRLLKIQSNNKLDYISDPLIDWDDNLRPFTDNLRGIEKGPLTRYYENNTFYRQPIIKSKLGTTGNILKNNVCFDLFTSKSKVKIDILDPFTFYDLSANEFYKSEEEAVNAFAEIIKKELNSIKRNVQLIQFNSPSLARIEDIDRLNMVKKAMEKIVKGLDTKTCLNLWGSDISNTLEKFQEFPVDIIGIDFTSSNVDKFDKIEMKKGLACGLIDAKNTKMEKSSVIIRELKNIKKTFSPESLAVITSWDFEFIPEPFADKKLQIMKQIKEKSKMMKL
ncbi:MAG: hypothetical protein MK228_00635 [Nitrososphaerales archaeon]|nr:hypothetical protein [Nitrososphaerales archaeon]